MACERYPGGHFVAQDHWHIPDALAETSKVLKEGTAPALFEAAFVHQGLLARADVIERLPGGGWRLIEVKSTTRLKDVFVLDAAFQLCVLRGAGLDVRDAAVMTLDRTYVYDGKRLDLDALFKLHDVFEQAEAFFDTVGGQAREMQALIADASPPDIPPGDHCFTPYECPYYAHCTRDRVSPDHGIGELPWLRASRRVQLEDAGIEEIRDIPDEFPLTGLQQRRSPGRAGTGRRGSREHLRKAGRTCAPGALPGFRNLRASHPSLRRHAALRLRSVPLLGSHRAQRLGARPYGLPAQSRTTTRALRLADRLLEAVGSEGSICMYSRYERQVLNTLAEALPDRSGELAAVSARLFDLLPVVRNTWYHPEFRGSFSIKNVLPVLVPGMGYGDLAVPDGQTASARYVQALRSTDRGERRRTFADLRAYCERDTLAMVRLREALGALQP